MPIDDLFIITWVFEQVRNLSFCDISHNNSVNWRWRDIFIAIIAFVNFTGQVWAYINKMFIKLICNIFVIGIYLVIPSYS